jgi:hypothetical protein
MSRRLHGSICLPSGVKLGDIKAGSLTSRPVPYASVTPSSAGTMTRASKPASAATAGSAAPAHEQCAPGQSGRPANVRTVGKRFSKARRYVPRAGILALRPRRGCVSGAPRPRRFVSRGACGIPPMASLGSTPSSCRFATIAAKKSAANSFGVGAMNPNEQRTFTLSVRARVGQGEGPLERRHRATESALPRSDAVAPVKMMCRLRRHHGARRG